ncbi:MAG TPA: CHAT domain-containing protein, partial [Allosphingosinicella sp.]|nr:CHAT domain-containing protein [Allosphingosinicella sp.]
QAPASRASEEYIGFGHNEPVNPLAAAGAGTRGAAAGSDCAWPLRAWNQPISPDELFTARRAIASAGGEAEVITDGAFSDTAIKERPDLNRFRVLHFATHGLVGGPRPDCPAQPALLTSFGGPQSDGLLTFAEIFDLRLDADLVILSACDTAGHGSQAAAEAAGISGSGDFSLDGLVRAFVGAGGRIVVGSHWPVPTDFNATQRLIAGLFTAPPGTGTAGALRAAQLALMDQADTSHPYYWSGFAVVGDGAVPVIRGGPARAEGGN